MPLPAPGQLPLYTSTVDCVKKTVMKEGVQGLYKGKIFNPKISDSLKISDTIPRICQNDASKLAPSLHARQRSETDGVRAGSA
jgi:hypothetical protein